MNPELPDDDPLEPVSIATLFLLCLALLLPGSGLAADAPTDPAELKSLLAKVDDAGRSDSSHATVSMQVKTKRYERSVTMEMWTEGTENSLIRILQPAKDKGVATLKVGENLWNYLPNTDRTMKVPAAMMSGAWMGSHLSNDDLVRESRLSDDYTYAPGPTADGDLIAIECTPKPDTPVPWGRVTVTMRPDGVPVLQSFFDEDGEMVRTLAFTDIRDIGGQPVAMTMRIVPLDKPDEFTEFRYDQLELDVSIDKALFSLQALKN
jgi:outer membrane lipoprotein-sorting protein